MEKILELETDHTVRLLYDEDKPTALVTSHQNEKGQECGGIIPFGDDEWFLVSEDPLTILPSYDCSACSLHGHILDGRWWNDSDMSPVYHRALRQAHIDRRALKNSQSVVE